jgi:hypothetical protein
MREFTFGGLWPRRCTKSPRECVRILPRAGLARPRSPSAVSEGAAARVGLTSLRAARSPHPSTKQMVATSGLFSVRRDAGLSLKGSVNSRRGFNKPPERGTSGYAQEASAMPPPSQSTAGVSLSSQVCVAPRTQPLAPQPAWLARRARLISKPLTSCTFREIVNPTANIIRLESRGRNSPVRRS